MIQTEHLSYNVNGATFLCELYHDDATIGARPCVMIAPAFWGLGDFERGRGRLLAEMGYAALVVDYYGEGRFSRDPAEARGWKDEVEADRTQLRDRMNATLALAKAGGGRCVARGGDGLLFRRQGGAGPRPLGRRSGGGGAVPRHL